MTDFTLYNMDVLKALQQIKPESVDCCITSPPYWGLRDYGVEGQIGLEEHPQQYIDKLVQVFSEVKKVLKPTGSLWLNLGDSYYGSNSGQGAIIDKTTISAGSGQDLGMPEKSIRTGNFDGKWLQPKQKMLMPHRVAIALQEDGWILRNDIVWHKPSHMPSSVKDRLTNSFEYVFHFVKQKKYYYDLDAIREPHQHPENPIRKINKGQTGTFGEAGLPEGMGSVLRDREAVYNNPSGKNPGDTWQAWGGNKEGEYFGQATKNYKEANAQNPSDTKRRILKSLNPLGVHPIDFWAINPKPYPEAHFACYPPALVEKPLKATCPKPNGIVLDPFVGSGTTLATAQELGLKGIGIEINPEYIPLIKKRILGDANQTSLNPNKLEVIT